MRMRKMEMEETVNFLVSLLASAHGRVTSQKRVLPPRGITRIQARAQRLRKGNFAMQARARRLMPKIQGRVRHQQPCQGVASSGVKGRLRNLGDVAEGQDRGMQEEEEAAARAGMR